MCGIVATISLTDEWDNNSVWLHTYACMKRMRNRGQEAAGYSILTPDESGKKLHRDGTLAESIGGELINQISREDPVDKLFHKFTSLDKSLKMFGMLGHVRYNTEGAQTAANVHPVRAYHDGITLDMVVNGETSINDDWKKEVENIDRKDATNDSSYIAAMIVNGYRESSDLESAVTSVYNRIFDWGMITAAGFLRDDKNDKNYVFWLNDGGHPLCEAITTDGKQLVITSETAYPSQKERAKEVTEMHFGFLKWFELSKRGINTVLLQTKQKCFFERNYLMSYMSQSEKDEVASLRRTCGRKLAEEHPPPGNSVVDCVPESGRSYLHGYIETASKSITFRSKQILGRDPSQEGLRAFMLQLLDDRYMGAWLKFEVTYSDCVNEIIVPIDDSIVGFNNLPRLVYEIRTNGHAKEVHVRIGTSPIVSPCRSGVDISEDRPIVKHLGLDPAKVAEDHTELEQKLCNYLHPKLGLIKIDSVGYLGVPALIKTYNKNPADETGYCFGCVTCVYPYKWAGMTEPYKFVPSSEYKRYIESHFLK